MAQSDQEIIDEALAFLEYGSVFDSADVQEIVDIGKDEIRSQINEYNLSFYQPEPDGTMHLDRALFWFTCVGLKIRSGEMASVNLTAGSIRSTAYTGGKFSQLTNGFEDRMRAAEARRGGPAVKTMTRADNRTYSEERQDSR